MLREFEEQEPILTGPEDAAAARRRSALEWLRFLLLLALFALVLRSCIIAPFTIPSRSMTPTLLTGDYLFVAKWPYGYSRYSFPFAPGFIEGRIGAGRPERGDVIVFRSPAEPDVDYVKRVIGLPGDRVRLEDGEVVVNGEPLPQIRIADFLEPMADDSACVPGPGRTLMRAVDAAGETVCRTPRYIETLPGGRRHALLDAADTTADNTREYVVPEAHYFLLGDDRDRSADSRFVARPGGGIGMVPEELIVGRVLVIFWSTDGSATWNPASWFAATRWHRIGQGF